MHGINRYPLDSAIGVRNSYGLDSDLSDGQGYATYEQLGPKLYASDLTLAEVFENVFAKLLDICGETFHNIRTETKHLFFPTSLKSEMIDVT